MSVNIKINGQTVNDIHAVQFENADAPGTNIQFYDVNSVQEEKTVTPTTSVQEIVPSSGKLLSRVTVEGVTSDIDSDIIPGNIKDGVSILGVGGTYANNAPKLIDGSITSLTEEDFEGVQQINDYAFHSCVHLASVDVPSGITSVGISAFLGCSNLEEISLPDSVTSIGNNAFRGCFALISVTLGDSIMSIGNAAFSFCYALTSLVIHTVEPPTIGEYALDGNYDAIIYVPAESVDAYKSASGWSAYASRIQAIPE